MTTDTQIRRLIFKNGWLRSHFTKYELFRSLDDEDKTGGTYWKFKSFMFVERTWNCRYYVRGCYTDYNVYRIETEFYLLDYVSRETRKRRDIGITTDSSSLSRTFLIAFLSVVSGRGT